MSVFACFVKSRDADDFVNSLQRFYNRANK